MGGFLFYLFLLRFFSVAPENAPRVAVAEPMSMSAASFAKEVSPENESDTAKVIKSKRAEDKSPSRSFLSALLFAPTKPQKNIEKAKIISP